MHQSRRGFLFGISAYLSWGMLPLYWALLARVDATEVLAHRIVWSFVFVGAVVFARRGRSAFSFDGHTPRRAITYTACAILIALNWGIYIWSVQNGYVLEASLGYFICPLMNIFVGRLLFGEQLSLLQWIAVALSFFSVLYLALGYGSMPWIALSLAVSFSLYGTLKKISMLGPVDGLFFESGILLIPAALYIFFLEISGAGALSTSSLPQDALLILSGVVTALPLIWFAAAAQLLPLSSIGMLQYLAPTCQFLLGVFWFGERLDSGRFLAFILIWFALILFSLEIKRKGRAAEIVPIEA